MAALGSKGAEFEPLSAIELTPGGVNSACCPLEVGEMNTSALVIGALHQRHTHSLVLHTKEEERYSIEKKITYLTGYHQVAFVAYLR